MSKVYEYARGQYHIHVKLSGEPDKITLFHSVMEKIDGAWPWGVSRTAGGSSISVCRKCKGFLLSNPRFAPQDLKACAQQCGVRIRIYVFSPQENCFISDEFRHTERVERKAAMVLTDHKPKRLTILAGKIYIGDHEAKPKLAIIKATEVTNEALAKMTVAGETIH